MKKISNNSMNATTLKYHPNESGDANCHPQRALLRESPDQRVALSRKLRRMKRRLLLESVDEAQQKMLLMKSLQSLNSMNSSSFRSNCEEDDDDVGAGGNRGQGATEGRENDENGTDGRGDEEDGCSMVGSDRSMVDEEEDEEVVFRTVPWYMESPRSGCCELSV